MDVEIVRDVLRELRDAPPREIIPSTMGEPLIYRDFDRILDLCCREGPRLNLTTNGTFPGRGARAWAEAIVPRTSDVKISINGARASTQERIMRGSALETALSNAREFIGVRDAHAVAGGNYCGVTFQVTFLEDNIDEMPALVRIAAGMGVDRVKGHHVWTHFPELEPLSLRRDPVAVARFNRVVEETRRAVHEHPRRDGRPVNLVNFFPLPAGAGTDIAPGAECPFLGKEAWINWEGRFDPCCAPDEQRKGLGSFGNVTQGGFLGIWRGQPYRSLCEVYVRHALCRSCNMRRPKDGEGCPV
jgi:MoaA/NifB/PqqE/SkfB family radical SAM enzyme